MKEQEERIEGWAWPLNARKAHYFRDGYSLCREWMYWGVTAYDEPRVLNFVSPDDCKACRKKVDKEKNKKNVG